jgi:hypothetical protein
MCTCVNGIHFDCFYDFLFDFRISATVWVFFVFHFYASFNEVFNVQRNKWCFVCIKIKELAVFFSRMNKDSYRLFSSFEPNRKKETSQ